MQLASPAMFQRIYDSERFIVVHATPFNGFEIVRKPAKSDEPCAIWAFLSGPCADAFRAQLALWQVVLPSPDNVEDVLEGYVQLATTPMLVH